MLSIHVNLDNEFSLSLVTGPSQTGLDFKWYDKLPALIIFA